ncbi:MAG: MFS transporter [Burkholderiaceae bacterium]
MRKRLFYGWRMVGAASGIQFLQAAMLYQALGAYVAILTEEKGWSKTSLSAGSALQATEAALIGPLLGWIIDRFGAQTMIRFGVLLFGAGFIAFSFIDTLPQFYMAIILIALGSSMCGFFPLNVAIVNWFKKYRARALSSIALGLALGGAFVPVVAWSMHYFGWRATAFGCGVVAIVVGLPLAMVFKRRPEDHGETLDGLPPPDPASKSEGGSHDPSDDIEFTARQALATPAFWLLGFGHGFALFVVTAVNVHAISHMKEGLGYTVGEASLVITLMTAFQVVGVSFGWWAGDRFQKRLVAATCMLMHAAGLLMLTYAVSPFMLVAFAVLHGSAWGLRGPFMQALRADYFGRRSIGTIMGLSSLLVVIGQIGGPLVAGYFADVTGNYRFGFTILACLAASGSVLFVLARAPKVPDRPPKPQAA